MVNPANVPAAEASKRNVSERKRVPMSVPRRKMETPEIPGFHCHWHLEENVPAAIQAGYEFVNSSELDIAQTLDLADVAGDGSRSGNQSLDSRISVIGNKTGGKPEYQYLMKLRLEWWNADRKEIDERHANMMGTIFRGEQILGSEKTAAGDQNLRYVDKERTGIAKALFNRPARKGNL